eukprot:GGOE01022387.1.p1 GENE.GGOE01022387.1~~GGOE01022387.1.p1  ORF type:complete len:696 (-),score=235.59 GGOE01022387.1:365-2395(-)
MGKSFLADYQVMVGEQEADRKELMNAFNAGLEHIRRNQKQRSRCVLDAMEEREVSEAEEAALRKAIEVSFVVEEEAVDRRAQAREENFTVTYLVALSEVQHSCLVARAEEDEQEGLLRDRLARHLQTGVEVLTAQAAERRDFAAAEEAARAKISLQRDAWDIKASARRGMLDLEHNEYICRLVIPEEHEQEQLQLFDAFQTDELLALGREEEAGRYWVQAEEGQGLRWLELEMELIRLQVEEGALRHKSKSFAKRTRKFEFEDFFQYTFELIVEEEAADRNVEEVRRDRFAADCTWFSAALALQHSEEHPRRRKEHDSRLALSRIHNRCVNEALELLQRNEDQGRGKLQTKWQRKVQEWRDQKQRLKLMGVEREERAALAKSGLQELKALVAQGRLGRALIGMIDLQAREVVAREALGRAERIQHDALLQAELQRRQVVARAVLEKAEHRSFERIGRGLENYLHMCGLDKASMLFDMWRPNDVLLVPFVVPPIKGSTRSHATRVAENARLRTASLLDSYLRDAVPRSIQTSSSARPSARWAAADNPHERQGLVTPANPTSPSHPLSPTQLSPASPKRAPNRMVEMQACDRVSSPTMYSRAVSRATGGCTSPSIPASSLERTFRGIEEVEAGVRNTLLMPTSRQNKRVVPRSPLGQSVEVLPPLSPGAHTPHFAPIV